MGGSGAGKSSVLRVLRGALDVEDGSIMINGKVCPFVLLFFLLRLPPLQTHTYIHTHTHTHTLDPSPPLA